MPRLNLFFVLGLILLPSCVNIIQHNPELAAKSANNYAKVLLLRQDYRNAFNEMSCGTAENVSFERFFKQIKDIHPRQFPSTLKTSEYEKIPGYEGLNILLYGTSNNLESFYYRFLMYGSVQKGYRVCGVFRGNQPYPPSPLRSELQQKLISQK